MQMLGSRRTNTNRPSIQKTRSNAISMIHCNHCAQQHPYGLCTMSQHVCMVHKHQRPKWWASFEEPNNQPS
jgi:hypothetical protein